MKEERKWEKGERITKLAAELANVCISAYEETLKTDPDLYPYLFKASSIGVQIAEALTLKDADRVAKLIFELAQAIYQTYRYEQIWEPVEKERSKDSSPSSDTPDKAQGGGR